MSAPTPDRTAAHDFAQAFRGLLDWVHAEDPRSVRGNEVVTLLRGHLGEQGRAASVVGRSLGTFEQVNLQVALDAWRAESGRTVVVHGVALPQHYGPVGLQDLVNGEGLPPVRLSAPDLVDLPSGPDSTVACWRSALLLVEDDRGRYVLAVRGPHPHGEHELQLELAGLPTAAAQDVQRELAELRARLNVYRGQLLELVPSPSGFTVVFPTLAPTSRDDVVLPEVVLRRIERHTVDVAARREELRAAGQHLKRGLLLYGPPGTGKTHTARYVVQRLTEPAVRSTVLLLSGSALHLVGPVTALARELQPAVMVLEDVDLVAEDRGYGDSPSSVLFELLDAMDGSAADADLLFLLTTNRADLLEPALAARPGRVDVAVEIGLPDAAARLRLLEVYSRGVPLELTDDDRAVAVARMEGVTASFVKELLRRAVLEALTETPGDLQVVTAAHLERALDDLLDSTQSVTRALLGVPADQSGPPAGPPLGAELTIVPRGGRGMMGHGGWFASPGMACGDGPAYGSSFEIDFDPLPEPPDAD